MSITIQNLPSELNNLIFEELNVKDLENVMKVCIQWEQVVKQMSNLVIDMQGDYHINKNITVLGDLLIRAKNVSNEPGICIMARKMTFVAETINYNGTIRASGYYEYANKSFLTGSVPYKGGYFLSGYSAHNPDFFTKLLRETTNNKNLKKWEK